MDFNLNSFIYESEPFLDDSLNLFDDLINDKNDKEFLLFNQLFCKMEEKEINDERNLNNITNYSETDKCEKKEKLNEKQFKIDFENDNELNETSLTCKEDDEDVKLQNENNIVINPNFIFKIEKKRKKKNKKNKKKKVRIIRKNDPDTIRRKIKPHFHKYFMDLLNKKIIQKKFSTKKLKKLLKINNHITSTVSINFNKKLLERKIGNILKEESISVKYRTYDIENNTKLINILLKKNDFEINKILNMKYKELFMEYLESTSYKVLLEKLRKKEGDNYAKLFDNVGNNFIFYFTTTEPKNGKKTNNNEIILKHEDKIIDTKENLYYEQNSQEINQLIEKIEMMM